MTGWSAGRHMALGVLASLVLVVGFGGWAMTARLAGAVIASGQVEVEHNRQVLQHPDGGVVAEILVTEGQRVAAGAPLLRLDGALIEAQLAIVTHQYFDALARQGRLLAERDGLDTPRFAPELHTAPEHHRDGQMRLFHARAQMLAEQVAQLEHRRAQARAQAHALVAQSASLEMELSLLNGDLAAQEALLSQGIVQTARVTQLRREAARLHGAQAALLADAAQVEDRSAEIGLQILAAHSQRRAEAESDLRATDAQILELAERRRALAEVMDRLELRAPVAGVVYDLAITTPRAVLRPAEPVVQIVPQDRPLVLALQISPNDINQVFQGQEAVVIFPGHNPRDGPELRGRLTQISADVFTDPRLGHSYFRAEVALEGAAGQGRTILPGMPVDVFLSTGARTALDYLTRPLTDHFRRALREE